MQEQKSVYVDLSTSEVRQERIPRKMREMYLGGRGLDMYLLYNHIPPGIDPLGTENVLTVSAGLLGGTMAPSSGRCHIGAKSPLTGLIGSSNMGGHFAPELRFAGIDHLVIRGKSEKPVYLWICDGEVEIRDGAHLWGKDTLETPAIIRKDHRDEEIKVMSIGLAGENLGRFANVLTGIKNAAGRTGMGCVMGSKKLKAIAVRGTQDLPISNPVETLKFVERFMGLIRDNPVFKDFSVLGTPMFHGPSNEMGRLRNRNLQRNQVPGGESLYADKLLPHTIGMAGCFGCPVHCRHRYVVPEGPDKGTYSEGPEWCTLGALGSEIDCGRMETILVANHLVNKYGIDSLETGSMIAWAIELYEKGIINDEHTGGLALEWGNEQILYKLIHSIVNREGLGDILAEGPLRAIEILGEESRYYNIQIKGMSCLHTDERPTPAIALGIATSTRGADHLRSRPGVDAILPLENKDELFGFAAPTEITSYEGSGKLVWWHELMFTVCDSLGVCKFQVFFMSPSTIGYKEYCELTQLITGIELSPEQMKEAAERCYTLERMFNNREGIGRKDDTLPEPYFVEPTPLGIDGFKGRVMDREKFEQQLDEYYQAHGWDRNGVPTPETLEQLDLNKL